MYLETPSDQIRTLVARLAHCADTGAVEEYLELFTHDAEWQIPANPRLGKDARTDRGLPSIAAGIVARRAAGHVGPGTNTRHVADCSAIEIRSETAADASSTWGFFTATDATPRLDGIGSYIDSFRFEGGMWKLACRKIVRG